MSATSKRAGGPGVEVEQLALAGAVGVLFAALAAVNAAVRLGRWIDGGHRSTRGNPFEVALGVINGTERWPRSGTPVLIGLVVTLTLLVATTGLLIGRRRGRRPTVDRAARHMGTGRAIAPLTLKTATAKAKRMGVSSPGVSIARSVIGGRQLYASWEDVSVDIWGPRTGKTVSRAIPAILEAPGAVLATSNKRDLVDATRDLRAEAGPAWVFDPQGLAGEKPSWWWNPLSYVTDETTAKTLADVFGSANTDPNAKSDAFFEPKGIDLLAGLLLAAAVGGRPITDVYGWVTSPSNIEPVDLLKQHDFGLTAKAVQAVINSPDKQRAGVYGTAERIASFLTNRKALPWITAGEGRREFDPHAFVRGNGTLYSLSKEGKGTTGPIVTGLTVAVCEAAETYAKESSGGRLPVPLVAVLDEAANVCRWRELPNLYSHYGSRGICVLTILQSWSQGVEVWGREGMRKLWSAANVKVYGGGVSEVEFLEEVSRLIGDFDLETHQVSSGRGGRSSTRATRRERILPVDELAAMPRGRAIVMASGVRASLAKTVPWMDGPHADRIRSSLAAHDPSGRARETAASADEPVNPWVAAAARLKETG